MSEHSRATGRNVNKELAVHAFEKISDACDAISSANISDEKTKEFSQLRIKCCKRMYAIQPNDLNHLMFLGGAYCMAGESLEGARYYRKAWDLHHSGDSNFLPLAEVDDAKKRLILAQMECPGGRLADYYVLGGQTLPDGRNLISFVPKEQKDFCRGIIRDEAAGRAVVVNSSAPRGFMWIACPSRVFGPSRP